eukprot:s2845_g4.t1
MDAAEAKRRKITYLKGEETANRELQLAGWKLSPTEDSQVLVPPSPASEEEEGKGAGEGKGKGKGKGKSKKRKRSETQPCEDNDDGDVTMEEAVAGDVNFVNSVNSRAPLESDQLQPPSPAPSGSDPEIVPAHGGGDLPVEAAAEPEPSDPGPAPEAVALEAEPRVEPPEAPHPPQPEPAPEAAAKVAGGPREVGSRIHSTPALLKSIEPMDWFKLRLDKNAHRFQVEMDKKKTAFMDYDKSNGGRAWYFWPQLLTCAFPHIEQCNNAVEVLVAVAERALANFVNCCEDETLQFVEFCSGKAQHDSPKLQGSFSGHPLPPEP